MNWWDVPLLSWTKPSDIKELRLHQEHELEEYYPKGNFWFTFKSKADKQPTLLISSKLTEEVDEDFKKLAAPAKSDECIFGTFESKGEAGTGTYEFTVDSSSSKTYLEKIRKDKEFSVLFWSSFVIAQPVAITLGGQPLMKRKMVDTKWNVCEWDLTRLMTLKAKAGVFDSAALPGSWQTSSDGKTRQFVMPHGVTLAEHMPIQVVANGLLVDKAKDSALIMQMMRDPVTAIMKEKGEALKAKLIELDEKIAASEKGDKKPKTEKELKETLDHFEKDFNEACVKAIHEEWCRYVVNNIEYKQFVFDCKVSVATSAITFTAGVVTAAFTGFTTAPAILGMLGSLEGALSMASTLYGTFHDLDKQSKELDAGLASVLVKYQSSSKTAVGATEVFNGFLERVPAGVAIKKLSVSTGIKDKDIVTLEKDLKTYSNLVKGFLPTAEETEKRFQQVLEEAASAGKSIDKAKKTDVQAAKQLEALHKALGEIQKAITTLVEDAVGKFATWDAGQKKSAEFAKVLDAIKKESPKTAEIIKAAIPMFELVYTIKPTDIVGAVTTVISKTAEMTSGLIDVLKKSESDPKSEEAKKAAIMIKNASDIAGKINGLAKALK